MTYGKPQWATQFYSWCLLNTSNWAESSATFRSKLPFKSIFLLAASIPGTTLHKEYEDFTPIAWYSYYISQLSSTVVSHICKRIYILYRFSHTGLQWIIATKSKLYIYNKKKVHEMNSLWTKSQPVRLLTSYLHVKEKTIMLRVYIVDYNQSIRRTQWLVWIKMSMKYKLNFLEYTSILHFVRIKIVSKYSVLSKCST